MQWPERWLGCDAIEANVAYVEKSQSVQEPRHHHSEWWWGGIMVNEAPAAVADDMYYTTFSIQPNFNS